MSDTFWSAFFVNLPAILTAIGVIFAAWWARQAKQEVGKTTLELVRRDERADGKLNVIHELTNSTLAAAKAAIVVLEKQNFDLQAINEQLEKRLLLVEGQLRRELLKPPPDLGAIGGSTP